MGRVLMSGGGGVDLDVITAAADDILSGKVIVDQNGDPLTGILTLSGNAGAGDVLTGKTFYNTNAKSKITGTMQTMSGGTYTPKSSQQTISCSGKYMTGNVVVNGVNIFKEQYFWVTSTNGSATFTAQNGSWSITWPYVDLYPSGFKQICGAVWLNDHLSGHAASASSWNVVADQLSYYGAGTVIMDKGHVRIPCKANSTVWIYGYAS